MGAKGAKGRNLAPFAPSLAVALPADRGRLGLVGFLLALVLQDSVILVCSGIATSGERALAIGLIFRRPPFESAARHVELVEQPLDRDFFLESQSRGGELELLVLAFSWHSLNTFPIETLNSPCP